MNAMKPHRRDSIPVSVYKEAHLRFREAVERERLFAATYFGHSHPHTPRTPQSVWRGVVRQVIRERTP